jgi:hypothetical protein
MDAPAPPKEKRALCGSAFQNTRLPGAYYFAPIVQVLAAPQVRCCVVCGCIVTNFNLGGNARHSALAGCLWCLSCSDGRQQ